MFCLQVTAAKILEIPVIATEQYPKGKDLVSRTYLGYDAFKCEPWQYIFSSLREQPQYNRKLCLKSANLKVSVV